ncbi:histidinol-phosphate phosphatase domain protein [Peptostreptococcaceae bacterium oral taxon 113 str. W5053]|nr:histidinol-phosphate phosphatase domain protein [Peptostreptococcaceae bacterium oral taxon 113 str. W5053]
MKVAFLDRDGTINKDYPDEHWRWIRSPEILPGAIEGMQFLNQKGYEIIIVSNQYLIGEGIISLEQYESFTAQLLRLLQKNHVSLLDVFYCPHSRAANCNCCKPNPGLIQQALRKYPDIELSTSFLCGDSQADLGLAENMGLSFYGIRIGKHPIASLKDLALFL